jgi:hypothetical protein
MLAHKQKFSIKEIAEFTRLIYQILHGFAYLTLQFETRELIALIFHSIFICKSKRLYQHTIFSNFQLPNSYGHCFEEDC